MLAFKGSGFVKGFAYTLAIGIVLSMFTALVVTRLVLHGLYVIGFRDAKFYGRQKDRRQCILLQNATYSLLFQQ